MHTPNTQAFYKCSALKYNFGLNHISITDLWQNYKQNKVHHLW